MLQKLLRKWKIFIQLHQFLKFQDCSLLFPGSALLCLLTLFQEEWLFSSLSSLSLSISSITSPLILQRQKVSKVKALWLQGLLKFEWALLFFKNQQNVFETRFLIVKLLSANALKIFASLLYISFFEINMNGLSYCLHHNRAIFPAFILFRFNCNWNMDVVLHIVCLWSSNRWVFKQN